MLRRITVAVLAICSTLALSATSSMAQQEQSSETKRKIVNRIIPTYPELARRMNVRGIVKLEALVASNGNVKSLQVRGGHPLLTEAAQNAILKWRWEPAPHETREPVEVRFDPR